MLMKFVENYGKNYRSYEKLKKKKAVKIFQ